MTPVARPSFDPRPVTLAGRHARLEPLDDPHAPDLARAGADPGIWTWLARGPFADEADALAWIDASRGACPTQGEQIAFAVIDVATGRAVGSTRYLNIQAPNRSLEIGWTWLAPCAQRTGVNTECKLMLLTHAFDALGAVRVQLKTDERNERSRRAIERLGASLEGILRNHMIQPGGRLRASAMYSITGDEWTGVRDRLRTLLDR